jgi:hypothetical protein
MFFSPWLQKIVVIIIGISIDLPCQPTGINGPPALRVPTNIALLEVDILKTKGLFTRLILEHNFAVS